MPWMLKYIAIPVFTIRRKIAVVMATRLQVKFAHNRSLIVKSPIAVHRNFGLYSLRPHMLHHRFLLASTFFSSSLDSI
jgi:hypothetical protein